MRLFPGRHRIADEGGGENNFTGDEVDQFAKLVDTHREKLYRVAFRMAGDPDDAQDLLQDALIEAYRSFRKFRQGTYFDKWLYRIMTNTFIDRQRQKKRAGRILSLDESADGEDSASREVADPESDPSRIMLRDELTEPLQKALDSLGPEFRMVIILADIEEFSYEEISAMMNVPVGTVRSRLHRARASVRAKIVNEDY